MWTRASPDFKLCSGGADSGDWQLGQSQDGTDSMPEVRKPVLHALAS